MVIFEERISLVDSSSSTAVLLRSVESSYLEIWVRLLFFIVRARRPEVRLSLGLRHRQSWVFRVKVLLS